MTVRILSAIAGAAMLAAQTQAPPVIRVTTRLVEVNVIVRDKNGPVKDLAQDDFTIFDRGKPQPIAFFAVNSIHDVKTPSAPLPASVFTNQPEQRGESPTSATVVLLDGLNTLLADQIWVKRQFTTFLKQMRPEDRIAVYSLGRNLRVLNSLTNDASRLLDTLDHSWVEAGISPDVAGATSIETRVNMTVEAMQAIANHMARFPGRKNLIWLSTSFPFTVGDGVATRTFAPEIERATRALNNANVAVYPVDARGLTGVPGLHAGYAHASPASTFIPQGQDTMQVFAFHTGGHAFTNGNDVSGAIRTLLDDSQVTYTLGFHPDLKVFDSSFHTIQVKVNRRGVDVRYREGYMATPDPLPTDQQRAAAIRNAIWSPLEATGIRVTAAVEKTPGRLQWNLTIAASDVALELQNGEWTATLTAVFAQRGADGRDLGTTYYRLRPHLNNAQHEATLQGGLEWAKSIALAAATAEAKVVIVDRATGKVGSLIVPISRAASPARLP